MGLLQPHLRRVAPILAFVAVSLPGGCGEADPGLRGPVASDTLLPVGGTRLFVHRVGAGEPVVVIHGGPLLDHGYLLEPLRPLAGEYELVFYDQRLSGRSDGTVDSASVSLDAFVSDVEGIRRTLGLGRIHLLGHSWGGLLALRYALDHPDRLRSLVLVSPMPPSSEMWQEAEAEARRGLAPGDTAGMGALRASGPFEAGDPAAIEAMLKLSFRSQLHETADTVALDFHIGEDYRERSRLFGLLAGDLASYDLRPRLGGLDVPVLLVYGASETAVGAAADSLHALLPAARLEVISRAGHFAFLERPDAFLPLVRSFLRR